MTRETGLVRFRAMRFRDRLRRQLEAPVGITDTIDDPGEVAADLEEEWPDAAEDQAGIDRRNAVLAGRVVTPDESGRPGLLLGAGVTPGRPGSERPDIAALENAETRDGAAGARVPHGYLRMWRSNLATLVAIVAFAGLVVGLVLVAYFENHGGL